MFVSSQFTANGQGEKKKKLFAEKFERVMDFN
jgi:hypothetical protein